MENQLIQVLKNLGLTDKEAKVYLACTELGTAIVSQIAKIAHQNRVSTYDILEKLKSKGLVSHYTKKKIKYFSALKPELLLEEFEKRTNQLRVSLPKFKKLTGETNHPRVRYFEGLEGIKTIYADTLTSQTEILNFSNSTEIREKWVDYDKEYVAQRAKKRIFLRGIAPKDEAGEVVQSEDEKYFRQMRLMPDNQFAFTNEINIYDDKVAIISFKDELIGMIIESHEIANSQRAIFNMCWQFAEHFGNLSKEQKHSMLNQLTEKELCKKDVEKEVEKQPEKDTRVNLSLF